MPFSFSADHIAAQAGGFEPQRLNHFSVSIAGLAQAVIITQSLLSFKPPEREIEEVTIPYGNETRKVAGKVTVSNAELVIVDYVDQNTWKTFDDWLGLVHDIKSGAIGYANKYKKEGTVSYYGPDGAKSRQWDCIGLWPKHVASEQFSMNSSERNNLSVELVCDKIQPVNGGAAN